MRDIPGGQKKIGVGFMYKLGILHAGYRDYGPITIVVPEFSDH